MPQLPLDSRPSLMIVDDDPDQLNLFRLAAERVGLFRAIATMADGAAALKAILSHAQHSFDQAPLIVLTDLKMPYVSGSELASRVQGTASASSVHVVAMSNCRYAPEVEAALSAGCCAFIQKPSGFQQLKALVASLPEICRAKVAGHENFGAEVELFA